MKLPRVQLHVDLGSSRFILLLTALTCLVFLWLAVTQFAHGATAQLLWNHADGEVTGIEYRGGYRRKTPFARFTFATSDGQIHMAHTPRTSAFHPAKVGDRVRIAYPSDDPARADLLHAGHLYGFALIHLLLAVFFGWLTRYNFDGAIHLSCLRAETPAPQLPADSRQAD